MPRLTKRQRQRLAKAELLMALASTAERWKRELSGDGGGLPPAEWPAADPFVTLCRLYRLAPADLARLCHQIGGELESRSLRAGYDERLETLSDMATDMTTKNGDQS